MKIINYMRLNQHPFFFRFQQNRTEDFQPVYHAHQGMELLYIHEGAGQAVIDRQVISIRPKRLLFFKPYQLHRVQIQASSDQPYIRSIFLFEPLALEKFLSPFPVYAELLKSLVHDHHVSQVIDELDHDELQAVMRFYKKRKERAQKAELLELQAHFMMSLLSMIGSVWRSKQETRKPSTKLPSVAEQIMAWIDEHYMEPFELEKLAAAVHLSPVHISALFRKHMGYSITEHLTARRIREACYLLKNSDMTVKEISEAVGLTNASYFTQFFKKNVGVTPYQYKKM